MSFDTELQQAISSGRPFGVVHTPDGPVVEYLAENDAEREAARTAARRMAALDAISSAERTSARALRELVLALVEPGSVPAANVTEARQRLLAADAAIRSERTKLM